MCHSLMMSDFGIFLNELILEKVNEKDDCKNEKIAGSKIGDYPFFERLSEFITSNNENLQERLPDFIESHAKLCETTKTQLEFIAVGAGLLALFIQKNWMDLDLSIGENIFQITDPELTANILKELVVDGENVLSVFELPEVLYFAKTVLEIAWRCFKDSEPAKIWYLRSLFFHQQILEELSPEIFNKISVVIDEIKNILNNNVKSRVIAYHLEFARIYVYYNNVQKSKEEVNKATELSGIDVSLSGALGKRTKFQTQDLAQLFLKVNIENGENMEDSPHKVVYCSLPKDVKLDDDVRLDKIKFADNVENKCPELTGLQQAVILANLFQTQKSQPQDGLADEELQPLISCILDQKKVWAITLTTLLLRSKIEVNHKRTVERALMQVQVVSESMRDPQVTLRQRFTYFFVSHMPPKWQIHSMLAHILMMVGSIKSALEIFQRLGEWGNVISCYNALQMRHKAKEIIEQELKKDPSPKFWCLLGDATDDVTCYQKAWELSNERSARAQRHWGYYYYHRKNYGECIEHFQKSLEINSLQKELWYRLGYAALVEENWEVSAHAYRRYCVLDPECFEAWNNLARCYCEMKQKYRGWRALQEALKVDYSNWRVWCNYMAASSDLKMFDEVIKSYHEVLNLKEKHLDIPVLRALVYGFKNWEDEAEGEAVRTENRNKFKGKLLALFGRLTSQIFNNAELWFLYSEVVDADSPESLHKKYELLMKAHRSAVNKADWEKDIENCNRIIYALSSLVKVGLQMEKVGVLMGCKLAAGGTLARIKKAYPDALFSEELESNLEKLDAILSNKNEL